MIDIVYGDLTTLKYGILAHQTNTLGKAGSGVVVDIKETFAKWYESYKDLCNQFTENPSKLLGTVQYFSVNNGLHVANLFAQFSIKPFNRNTDLKAFEECCTNLHATAIQHGLPVYMPSRIASDRGGMDREAEIIPILEKVFGDSPAQLYLVEYIKGQSL